MNRQHQFAGLTTSCFLLAMLVSTHARAALYTGNAATSFSGPFGGTTDTPATYQAASGQETAISSTSSAMGGSGFVRTASFSQLANASMLIEYTIRLVGPSARDVPVNLRASGYADGAGYYNAGAAISVGLTGMPVVFGAYFSDRGRPFQSDRGR